MPQEMPNSNNSTHNAKKNEQRAIWLIRNAFSKGASLAADEACEALAIGPRNELTRCLVAVNLCTKLWPRREHSMLSDSSHELSEYEYDLLTILATFQQGQDAANMISRTGWAAGENLRNLGIALDTLARILSNAGIKLTAPAGRALLSTRRAAALPELDARETLIVEALRVWVDRHKSQRCGLTRLMHLLSGCQIEGIAAPMHSLMIHTVVAATRPVLINCKHRPELANDEARILHCVSTAQREELELATVELASWLPPTGIRLGLRAVVGIADALTAASLLLPFRAWCFAELSRNPIVPVVTYHPPRLYH